MSYASLLSTNMEQTDGQEYSKYESEQKFVFSIA